MARVDSSGENAEDGSTGETAGRLGFGHNRSVGRLAGPRLQTEHGTREVNKLNGYTHKKKGR